MKSFVGFYDYPEPEPPKSVVPKRKVGTKILYSVAVLLVGCLLFSYPLFAVQLIICGLQALLIVDIWDL